MFFRRLRLIVSTFSALGICLASFECYANGFPQLNDTGITYGGNYPKGISADCSASVITIDGVSDDANGIFATQQDCANGLSDSVSVSNNSTFQYKKVSNAGVVVALDTPLWSCVLDETSNLMWEVKHLESSDSGLHLVDDKFTWYNSNPKENGGDIGDWNRDSDVCAGYDISNPRSYCHIEQFVKRVNKKALCGFSDWRVPSRAELTSLIHFGASQPAIDTRYFPNTINDYYWVRSPVVGRNIEAWAVNFEFGSTSPLRKTDLRPVRLVRDVNE